MRKNDFDVQFAAIDRAASDTAKAVIKSVMAPVGEPDPFDELYGGWSTFKDEAADPGK
jgi:hypothetical protein